MRYAVIFGTASLASLLWAWFAPWWWFSLLALWVGGSMGLASLAYASLGASMLGKREDGTLPAWSFVLHGPFLLLALVSMRVVNGSSGEAVFDRVARGVLLGRRPSGRDRGRVRAVAPAAVVDLCAELPRSRVLSGEEAYLPLPVLDGMAPTEAQLDLALDFVDGHRERGPVLVHCALGHSRSATVVIAWLLASGQQPSIGAAEAALQAIRPGVVLTPAQRDRLTAWVGRRSSSQV